MSGHSAPIDIAIPTRNTSMFQTTNENYMMMNGTPTLTVKVPANTPTKPSYLVVDDQQAPFMTDASLLMEEACKRLQMHSLANDISRLELDYRQH